MVGSSTDPAWSHNGKLIAFNLGRNGTTSLFRRPADGSGSDELLAEGKPGALIDITAPDWSPDDKFIVFTRAGRELWVLPLDDPRVPFALVETPHRKWEPAFSPDGRWIV